MMKLISPVSILGTSSDMPRKVILSLFRIPFCTKGNVGKVDDRIGKQEKSLLTFFDMYLEHLAFRFVRALLSLPLTRVAVSLHLSNHARADLTDFSD
mmetsp:Transcript_8910/g.15686  ORF Transcript_8910/g.15686 Transcript_8910/m.15686 type:complete len:97 (+) Transcript_8910:744-1034(+)